MVTESEEKKWTNINIILDRQYGQVIFYRILDVFSVIRATNVIGNFWCCHRNFEKLLLVHLKNRILYGTQNLHTLHTYLQQHVQE